MKYKTRKQNGGSIQEANTIIAAWSFENNPEIPLNLARLNLTTLPDIPDNVKILLCEMNKLTSLPTLPSTLVNLHCQYNKLTELPTLPNNIKALVCGGNQLTTLPILPNSLDNLYCEDNKLTTLPELPNSLKTLYCASNKLTTLPELPDSLKALFCDNNKLTILPTLPESLEALSCNNNQLDPTYYNEIDPVELFESPGLMNLYVERIRQLQNGVEEEINVSKIKEVNEGSRNYIDYENIKNGNILANMKRSANKYNSNYKEYIKKNTYNTLLHKTLKHPLTRYKMKKNNIKYYTAKVKKNNKN